MGIIWMVLLFDLMKVLEAIHCDKIFNYHENYGYGFDITCEGLTNKNKGMLMDISVSNEIILTINNSNLTEVTPNLFQNVSKIKFLILKNSLFTFNPNEYIFADLLNLEHLTIENMVFNNLYVLQDLVDLKELSFVNTSLKVLKKGTFRNSQKVESLTLTKNHFENMSDIPFCELVQLKYLHLDQNNIRKIEGNFTPCFRKENSSMKINGLRYVMDYENVNRKISEVNLLVLNVSSNEISFIDNFEWALSLKHVDLSYNKLHNISKNVFSVLKDLERLNLDNNFITSIDPQAFGGLSNLKIINLQKNLLSSVTLKNLTNLIEVNLASNNLKSQSLTNFGNLPRLQILLLQNNLITNLPPNCFDTFPLLKVLDLSSNKLILENNLFKKLSYLKQLNLRNNSLQNIPVGLFKGLANLEILDISINNLEKFESFYIFTDLDSLQILNMSHNLLQYLHYDLVKPLHNLQVLDISGNKLQNFQISLISLLPSLQIINLKSNLLSCGVLAKIIVFLKSKNIDYTINEEFEYDRQNIEGIYCKEMTEKIRFSSIVGIIFLVVASSIGLSCIFYRCMLYTKRRRYIMDEIELL